MHGRSLIKSLVLVQAYFAVLPGISLDISNQL